MGRLFDFLFGPARDTKPSTRREHHRFRLANNADLTPEIIASIEAHVRWVAHHLDSPAWEARIYDVLVDNSVHKDSIGLCWSRDDHRGRPHSRRVWVDARLGRWDETETLIHELSHAFTTASESHGPLFRKIYIVAYTLYTNADNREVRAEVRSHLSRYQDRNRQKQRFEEDQLVALVEQVRPIANAERARRVS